MEGEREPLRARHHGPIKCRVNNASCEVQRSPSRSDQADGNIAGVLTPRRTFEWLLALESPETPPQQRDALSNGYELAKLAATDGFVDADEQGHGQLAMALGELRRDDWVRWDWQAWPDSPEPTSGRMYQSRHLQQMDNVRLTPQGVTAHAARAAATTTPRSTVTAEPSDEEELTLRDAFISHAGEDKDLVARPLAEALKARDHSVWFDEAELVVGSSLSEAIDEGLASSRFGVVVLSPAFFAKRWPRRELSGLVAKEMAGTERVILPIWHGLTQAEVTRHSAPLGDLLASDTSKGIDAVADEISRAIRRRRAFERARGRPLPAQPAPGTQAAQESSRAQEALELRDRFVGLIRAEDAVGERETLRGERRSFETHLLRELAEAGDAMGDEVDTELLRALEAELWTLVERRAATLLPLLEYRPEQVKDELAALAALADRQVPTRSRLPMWRHATRPTVWMLVHLVGAYAVADGHWQSVREMWRAQTSDGRPIGILSQAPAERLGLELARARPRTFISSRAVPLWHLSFSVASSELLIERYSELVSAPGIDDPVSAILSRLGDYSWLMTALATQEDVELEQWWRAGQVRPTLSERLSRDRSLRETLSETVLKPTTWPKSSDPDAWVADARGVVTWE